MSQTPNHGYNVPNEGEQDWHEPLNENFERYDTDIEIRDVFDNIHDYEPKDGAKFLATDTETVFIGDGTRWNDLATSGEAPSLERIYLKSQNRSAQIEFDDADAGADNSTVVIQGLNHTGDRFSTVLFEDSGDSFPAVVATRDGTRRVGIGVASPQTPLDVRSQNNWNLDNGDGDVRIGDDDHRLAIGVSLGGVGRGTARLRAKGGTEQLKLGAGSSDTVTVQGSSVSVDADLDVSGNKNFVQSVDTDGGEKEVVYTAMESGTPHTEVSGVAELEDGRAAVDLPDHFGWVTSGAEPLHVQTTPHSAESGGLAVVERSRERIVVEDLDGVGAYELSYTVTGTRAGHEDKQVVREPSETPGRATDQPPSAGERHAGAD